MSSTLPSPPLSRSTSPVPDTSSLMSRLDQLLAEYLALLDQYTTLRTRLSETFSPAFLSLAQAQRTSTLGPARRYGEECYDQRMKAQRRLLVELSKDAPLRVKMEKVQASEKPHLDRDGEKTETEKEREDVIEQKDTAAATRTKIDPADRDPISWFGILVPPSLKLTQRYCVTAVEELMPALVNVDAEMKALEVKIWHVRTALGVRDQY